MKWTEYREACVEPAYEALLPWGRYTIEWDENDPIRVKARRPKGAPKWTGPWKVTVTYNAQNGKKHEKSYVLAWVPDAKVAKVVAQAHAESGDK